RREERVDRRRSLCRRRGSARLALRRRRHGFLEGARVAAAALDALEELLLLVGRHVLEALEHPGLTVTAVATTESALTAAAKATTAAEVAASAKVAAAFTVEVAASAFAAGLRALLARRSGR